MSFEYTKTGTLLSAKNISKSYDNKLILRDVTFAIKDIKRPDMTAGQISAVVGASGVGKSTLFYIIAGLLKADGGQILIDAAQKPVCRGDVGVVFQNYFVYDWRRVIDIFNISVKKNSNIKVADRKDYIASVVEEFELIPHTKKYPNKLSGGQKQRVAIAEQIINGGNTILFDEPFSGQDALVIDKVIKTFIKVANQDELKTLLLISHDLSNSIAISDSVFVIGKEEGKEGAVIKKEIDLIERGLAWRPDIKSMPTFIDTVKEVKSLL